MTASRMCWQSPADSRRENHRRAASAEDRAAAAELLYKRLYISLEDFGYAHSFVAFIISNGLHFAPWEAEWSIYMQQSAFTSAAIVFYCRPFTASKGLPNFPKRLIRYDGAELQLHRMLLDLRHQVYAHSDANRYRIQPTKILNRASAIVGAPPFRLTIQETQRLSKMISGIQYVIEQELERLIPEISRSTD